jgi:hypothetical protein
MKRNGFDLFDDSLSSSFPSPVEVWFISALSSAYLLFASDSSTQSVIAEIGICSIQLYSPITLGSSP